VSGSLSLLIHAAWPLDPGRIRALQLRHGLDGEGPTACGKVHGATGRERPSLDTEGSYDRVHGGMSLR
jgi:hypothetical protein